MICSRPAEITRGGVESLLLRVADHCAGALGLLSRPFSVERLIAAAERQTGLRAPDEALREPLKRLLESFIQEADLSCVGRAAVRWDTLRFLGNGLRLRAAEQQHPSIRAEPIDGPIFITGLPRSGTTFLHRLMLEDAQNRAPLVWETIYPIAGADADSKRAQVNRQLRTFERLAPEFRGLHPLSADSPQECSEISAHVFRSYRFDSTFHVPSYRRWLDAEGSQEGYLFERRFLQHLQRAAGPRRWVLKCPDHLFALRDLRVAFPDARVVFVHRDPVKVLLSLCKLTEVLRRPFSRTVDRDCHRPTGECALAGRDRTHDPRLPGAGLCRADLSRVLYRSGGGSAGDAGERCTITSIWISMTGRLAVSPVRWRIIRTEAMGGISTGSRITG